MRVVSKGPGQTKAWVEYQTPQQALTAREHDQTVSHHSLLHESKHINPLLPESFDVDAIKLSAFE